MFPLSGTVCHLCLTARHVNMRYPCILALMWSIAWALVALLMQCERMNPCSQSASEMGTVMLSSNGLGMYHLVAAYRVDLDIR